MTTAVVAKPKTDPQHVAENSPDASLAPKPNGQARPDSCPDHSVTAPQDLDIGASSLPDATAHATPIEVARPATPCPDQKPTDTLRRCVGATPCDRQSVDESQNRGAVAKLNGSQERVEAQTLSAAVELLFCAEFLDDVEKVRIASENRLRAMAERGIDLTAYEQQVEAFRRLEHEATLQLQRTMRRHPLGPWIKATKGIGEKQGARLLAAIGDVTHNHADDRPRRGPAELWAYCGFVPGQKRRKGVRSNWNSQAKMRAFLVAESCMKQRTSPYRATYDSARANWAIREASDLHKHNHALRLVAKAVLRDLFLEAQRAGA